MAHMVVEGVEVPGPTEISRSIKRIASDLIAAGPPELSDEDERKLRYSITNLIDDIRQPRSKEELVASARNCTARWLIIISARMVCGRRSTNPFLANSAELTPNFMRSSAKASKNYSPSGEAIK